MYLSNQESEVFNYLQTNNLTSFSTSDIDVKLGITNSKVILRKLLLLGFIKTNFEIVEFVDGTVQYENVEYKN